MANKATVFSDEKDLPVKMNRLAREQFKTKLYGELLFDMQVCALEHINPTEYLRELKEIIDYFLEKAEKINFKRDKQ